MHPWYREARSNWAWICGCLFRFHNVLSFFGCLPCITHFTRDATMVELSEPSHLTYAQKSDQKQRRQRTNKSSSWRLGGENGHFWWAAAEDSVIVFGSETRKRRSTSFVWSRTGQLQSFIPFHGNASCLEVDGFTVEEEDRKEKGRDRHNSRVPLLINGATGPPSVQVNKISGEDWVN